MQKYSVKNLQDIDRKTITRSTTQKNNTIILHHIDGKTITRITMQKCMTMIFVITANQTNHHTNFF